MNLQQVVHDLGDYVEAAYKGANLSRRKTASEGLCDLVPSELMQIVFGKAFQDWNGARLAWLVENMPSKFVPQFVKVAAQRLAGMKLGQNDKVGLMETDALLGILKIAKKRCPLVANEVEQLAQPLVGLVAKLEW